MLPFPGGPAAEPNATLIFSLLAAIYYFLMLSRPPSWRRTVVKAGSVALLAVLALVAEGPTLLVAALAACALGDAFLAQEGERAFLAGLASFLLGHLAYVWLFAAAGGGPQAIVFTPWRLALAIALALLCLGLVARLRGPAGRSMRGPVAVYGAVILAMALAALTLPVPLVIAGAVLFVASDAVLAAERFLLDPTSPYRPAAGAFVWIAYYAAQLLITLGVLTA